MENKITNYKNYTIYTEEDVEKGLFFRKPIQIVTFDAYVDNPKKSAWDYLHKIKNPIRRFYEILIGNKEVVDKIDGWSKDVDWGGFLANILCTPIYFKRNYRKLKAISTSESDNIREIYSYGYESQWEMCSGGCYVERTKIVLKNGKKISFKRRKSYYYTYRHIVEDIIDTGEIELP